MTRTRTVSAIALVAALAGGASLYAFAQGGGGGMRTPEPVDLTLADAFVVPEADAQTTAIVEAATAFLDSLSAEQRAATVFALDDNQQRATWSNFPTGVVQRSGVARADLTEEQIALEDALMQTVLSADGWQNAVWQMQADEWLNENDSGGGGNGLLFSEDLYYISFVGEPAADQPFMVQFGGHHLAYNVTVFGSDVAFAPMLTGGQPVMFEWEGETIDITAEEVAAAHALLDSLDPEQMETAVRGSSFIQLLAGPGEDGTVVAPEGLTGADMTEDQRALLMALIETRVGFANDDDAGALLARIEADLDETYFGWWGPTDGAAAYWRVTGPTILMEFSPQEMGDDAGNHIHAMYRDPTNDYGAAWLAAQ